MNDRAKVTGFKYDEKTLESNLRNALEKVCYHKYIKRDSRVFVKPNFTAPFFKPGVTTNGSVLEVTLRVLKDLTSEVYVGESDGGNYSFTAEYSLNNHNVPEICKRTGAKMINLSETEWVRVTDNINGKKTEVTIPRPLFGMDVTVSIPVLKVHVVTKVTLSLKNLWGCHPDTFRLIDHNNLSERLALIAKCVHLKLVIVDAIYGLNNHGPMDGDVVDIGGIIVGNNPVATDAVATRLMGFNPEDIDHIVVASKAGLGAYKKDEIDIIEDLTPFQQSFNVSPTLVDKCSSLTFNSYMLNKLVMDSPFTTLIYKITRREYRKKILKPGDEV
jgi:uncharacterized protein (DUF362 family)